MKKDSISIIEENNEISNSNGGKMKIHHNHKIKHSNEKQINNLANAGKMYLKPDLKTKLLHINIPDTTGGISEDDQIKNKSHHISRQNSIFKPHQNSRQNSIAGSGLSGGLSPSRRQSSITGNHSNNNSIRYIHALRQREKDNGMV